MSDPGALHTLPDVAHAMRLRGATITTTGGTLPAVTWTRTLPGAVTALITVADESGALYVTAAPADPPAGWDPADEPGLWVEASTEAITRCADAVYDDLAAALLMHAALTATGAR